MNKEDSAFYGPYSESLEKTDQWLLTQLEDLLNTISVDPELQPAEHLTHRIKSAESLKWKLQIQGIPNDIESALRQTHDIIGARLVVHFIGDVYELLEAIKGSSKWHVDKVKDYIANPKPNGYRSLHILLSVPFNAPGFKSLQIELQVRTIAMDCWASLEHQLHYKKKISHTTLIEDELKRCASEMASTDLSLQTIYELIIKGEHQ